MRHRCKGYVESVPFTEPLINRNPGSSKTYMNQKLKGKNSRRVIFRVIDRKL